MTISSVLKKRVRYAPYLERLVQPQELVPLFRTGQNLGWSGFTGVGAPKIVPQVLADHVATNSLQGQLRFNLFVGASAGPEESRWAELDMISRRSPHQVGKPISRAINDGRIQFFDKHLSMFPQDLTYGFYTRERPAARPSSTTPSLKLPPSRRTAPLCPAPVLALLLSL